MPSSPTPPPRCLASGMNPDAKSWLMRSVPRAPRRHFVRPNRFYNPAWTFEGIMVTSVNGVNLLTVDEAAERLGTGIRFVRRLVAERRIRFYKVGKYVRFHPDDLAAYIQDGRVDPIRPVLVYRKGVPTHV